MKVKVHCPCGAKFEFEVEPANGRMPVPINCPTCGAEATELANAVIQQQLTSAVPHPAPVRVAVKSAHHRARARRSATGEARRAVRPLRIAKSGPAVAVYEGPADLPEAGIEPCHRHPSEPAVDHCAVCGKAICEKCRQQFGHVCSIFCREASTHRNVEVPVYSGQRGRTDERAERRVKLVSTAVAALLAVVLGTLAWCTLGSRAIRRSFSPAGISTAGAPPLYELIAPGQLFSVKDGQATLLDMTRNATLWSVTVPADFMLGSESLRCLATTNDVWLVGPVAVLRLDRQTGARKDLTLPDNILEIGTSAGSILVVSHQVTGTNQLTRISLADGTTQTEDASVTPGSAAPARGNRPPPGQRANPAPQSTTDRLRGLATAQTREESPAPPKPAAPPQPMQQQYLAAGSGAVQFTAQLLEYKTVVHEAMKQRGKSVLDSGNVTASQGIDLAEEMMNDSKREETGGVDIEDVSRYHVTLHRLFAKDVPDWSGEVTGPPRLITLKSVDLLVAGTNLYVFDQNNKKLWEAHLAFLPRDPDWAGPDSFPCLEKSDALFFADKGVLTRFDLFTGNVRWRLTSVGISEMQMDDRGNLYVDSTTAGAESIRFSQQVNLRNRVELVIMRVDPAQGKVLWSSHFDSTRYRALPSGKFLFSTREWQEQDPLRMEDGPDNNFQHQTPPCLLRRSHLDLSPRQENSRQGRSPAKLDPAPIHRRRPRPEVFLALKSFLKSRRAWLTAAVLVAIAALVVPFVWPKPPRQIVTLANGDSYEFVGTAYGTNLVPPSLLCRITGHLPAGLNNIVGQVVGNHVTWLKDMTPEHPEFILWFRRLKGTGPTPLATATRARAATSGITILQVAIADENGFEVPRENYGMFISSFSERTMWTQSTFGWSYVALGNLPKRSPVLQVIFREQNSPGYQQINLRNPFYRNYPQWEASNALPASRDAGELSVQVGKMETVTQSGASPLYTSSYLQTPVSWPRGWDLLSAGLDDATGNHVNEIPPHVSGSGPPVGRTLQFPSAFWPGEDTWRLRLVFKRVANYPPDDVITFKNVPIPPVGSTNFVPITNSAGGVKVRISQFSHGDNSTYPNAPPYSSIAVDLPDHPAEIWTGIIDLRTTLGGWFPPGIQL